MSGEGRWLANEQEEPSACLPGMPYAQLCVFTHTCTRTHTHIRKGWGTLMGDIDCVMNMHEGMKEGGWDGMVHCEGIETWMEQKVLVVC